MPGARASSLVQGSRGCLCVGTSLQVYPAAGLAEAFARAAAAARDRRARGDGLWEDAELRILRAAEELLPAVAAILIPEQP